MGGNVVEDGADAVLEVVRQFFVELDEWVPVLGHFLEMIMEWPEARHERIYDLTGYYQDAATLFADHLDEVSGYLQDYEAWQGDGAAQLVREQLQAHFDEVGAMGGGLAAMQEMVHGKALEIESMKWMAIINLVMLGIAIVQMLVTAWTGVGALVGAGEIAFTRAAMAQLVRRLLTKLWEQTIKAGVRNFVRSGVSGVAKAALRGGLVYSGFIVASKGGITLIQTLEGHDPFTEGFAGRFATEAVDGFIAGAIGGPLMFGVHSRVTEAVAFGTGQLADNVLQIGRDNLLDAAGLRDWAQRNGLYSGMTWDQITNSLTTAALLGEILTETGRSHHPDLATAHVRAGAADLFGNQASPTAGPAGLPDGLRAPDGAHSPLGLPPGALPAQAGAPNTVGAPNPAGTGSGQVTPAGSGTHGSSTQGSSTQGSGARTSGSPTGSTTPSTPTASSPTASSPTASSPTASSPTASSPTASSPSVAEPTGADPTAGTPQGGDPIRSHATPETGALAPDATRHVDPTPAAPPPAEASPAATATPTPEAHSTDAPASAGQSANAPTGTAGTPHDSQHGQVGSPGDSSTAPAGGDGGARRDDPQWWEWKKRAELRFQDDYAHAVAGGFGTTSSGPAGTPQATAPRLTPEVVQHALNARPDALTPYGNRLRNYLEQHFSRIDETGTRRPLDSAEIAAKLEQLRGDGPTRTGVRTITPEETSPEPSPTPDGTTTSDGAITPERTTTDRTGPDGTVRPEGSRTPDGSRTPEGSLTPEVAHTPSPDPASRHESETSAGQLRPEPSHVDPELAPSSNFSPNLTRTGADLPRQVNELVDRARANLLDHYPADAVAGRIRDLDDIARIADRLQVSADAARAGADMGDVVRQVRELSSAVNQYSDRYRDWRDFTPDAQAHRRVGDIAHPGWRDLDGVDPLNSVEMANRAVSIDPATGRFDPIDQAIAIAKIGDVLGPEFEAHATRLFQRSIPMDLDSVRAALPDSAITPEIVRQVTVERPRGVHDPELGVTFVDPRSGSDPRSISAVAATIVHEGMHALQPNNALLRLAIIANVRPDAVALVRAQLRFEREYQGFAVQQQFLRGLAGFRSADPTADPRIPNLDGYRELAAQTPAQLRDLVLRRYIPDAVRVRYGLDSILTDFKDLTPENIVNQARSAIIDSIHPIDSYRQQGNLYGPITRHVVDTHGLDLDGIRHRQAQLSVPALRDPGSSGGPPSPDQSTGDSARDGHGHAEAELGAGQGNIGDGGGRGGHNGATPDVSEPDPHDPHRNDVARSQFGDLNPEQRGPLGERYQAGVHDNYDGTHMGFDAKERETANLRAEEGRLVTRLPEHPLNNQGYNSLEARERTGPDDPGRDVEYKDVSRNTKTAVDSQLKRAFAKFVEQPDGGRLEGDIVIDGRRGDLSLDNAVNSLKARLGRMLSDSDPRLTQVGKVEIYLGDGSRVVFQDGRITHVTERGTTPIGAWDRNGGPTGGRFVDPTTPPSGPEGRPPSSGPAGHTHTASPIADTGFRPDGRPEHLSDVTVQEFRNAVALVSVDDFGGHSILNARVDGPFVRVETADGRIHVFEPVVGRGMDNVAETTMRSGTPDDPHLVRINNRVASEQLGRTWVHEITETIQEHAAAHRSQPQGIMRRAAGRLAVSFGMPGHHPARPGLPETPPHTAARLSERRYLMRELDAARTHAEQVRLRAEIDGVDRDLAHLGHPTHELPPAPDVTHAAPDTVPDEDHSTHDEIWSDPPWQREDRRPSLDELIPQSHEEVGRWGDTIRAEFARQLDGREFAGMRFRLDLSDPDSVSVYRNDVTVRMDVIDPDRGYVGRFVRSLHREHDGTLYVEHNSARLFDSVQGRGFATEANRFLEAWYRYSGVDRIEIHASSTVGGYAWARAGYDWAPNTEHRANAVLQRLRAGMRAIDDDVARVGRWAAGDNTVDIGRMRERYGVEDPDALVAEMRRQQQTGQHILDQAARHPFDSEGYPSPQEISLAGWNSNSGADATWLGKEALLGADWKGIKPIVDSGPLHPRSAHLTHDPSLPHPSTQPDGVHRPITAAEVPDSRFHGYGRDAPEPALVQRAGQDALNEIVGRLSAHAARPGVRLAVTTVSADSLPQRAVARSVPVDAYGRDLPPGTVPPEGGGYRIELSDRAADVNIPRAVAHEVAELAAIRQRAADGLDLSVPDALRPGEPADGSSLSRHDLSPHDLSPHDLGRLAEVEVLARMLADPEHYAYARSELAALREHLGLRPDEPGSAARHELVDTHLSADARAALEHRAPAADVSAATALAVASRTPDGLVDATGLANFVATVPHLDIDGSGGLSSALSGLVAEATGRDDLRLSQLGGGPGKGQSGAPIFLVRDPSGGLAAIAKIFPGVEELVRELSAIDRLGADEFAHFRAPEVLGAAVADLPAGVAGALVMSVAPGRPLFDMISDLPGLGSPDRPAALTGLRQALRDSALAFAELHSRPVNSGGPVDRGFLEFNHRLAQRETAAVAAHGEVLRGFGLDVNELTVRVDEAIRAALADPGGAAIMHGDAHPGNVFWDPIQGVTFIDTPHAHFSIDGDGAAIGTPARDISNMVQRLAHFSREAGLSWDEVADLQATFLDAYERGGGPAIPEAARTAFAARFAVRDVLDTLTALGQQGISVERSEQLSLELRNEIRLLRMVLGWDA